MSVSIGQRFGQLTVISGPHTKGEGKRTTLHFLIRCECGRETLCRKYSLTSGHTKSCGCQRANTIRERYSKPDGDRKHPLYRVWLGMRERCYYPKNNRFYRYGARGIKVCDRWHSFSNFRDDNEPLYRQGLTIDRENNDMDYSPSNCRWITHKEQASNKSNLRYITFNGVTLTLNQWSERTGINVSTLKARIDRHAWSVERALTAPLRGA